MKYRKKPVVIEAVQWLGTPESMDAIRDLNIGGECVDFTHDNAFIVTLEGQMNVDIGDWVIRGVKNELYPCKPDIFEMTYERVD